MLFTLVKKTISSDRLIFRYSFDILVDLNDLWTSMVNVIMQQFYLGSFNGPNLGALCERESNKVDI